MLEEQQSNTPFADLSELPQAACLPWFDTCSICKANPTSLQPLLPPSSPPALPFPSFTSKDFLRSHRGYPVYLDHLSIPGASVFSLYSFHQLRGCINRLQGMVLPSEMAQWVRALVIKADDLSSLLKTHVVAGDNLLSQAAL